MSDKKTETTIWQPNDEQRNILEAIQAEADKEESMVAFASRFTPWGRGLLDQMLDAIDGSRVNGDGKRKDSYFDKVSESVRLEKFAELQNILEEIPRKRLELSRIRETRIVATGTLRAVETAIREAAVKPGPERNVMVLGPTGAGKTMICNFLAAKHSARIVEVRDAWRRSESGYVPLLDICRAVGYRVKTGDNNIVRMEDGLVRFCGTRNILLCFDEGEFFGRAALNKLKFLLNKTRTTTVIFAVTGEYEKWFDWFPNEAEQTARRTHAIIETSVLEEKDVALFFPAEQFADRAKMLKKITGEASRFGHFSLVKRVALRLENIDRAEESDVNRALESARKQMRREVSPTVNRQS